jgi:hypothetical protein
MNLSAQISVHVLRHYIEPARRRGLSTVEVRAGDVHQELGLKNRVASVCTTLESQKFQRENHLSLLRAKGPNSGRSTTVTFAYQLLDPATLAEKPKPSIKSGQKLMALYGICAETFRELGGGEEYLRRERDWGPDAWERYEAEEKLRQAGETAE